MWQNRQTTRRSGGGPSAAGYALALFVAAVGLLVQAGVVRAESARVALVMGNGAYDSSIGRLKNPVNDAELMADT
ncbi:hypothetical protein A8950_0315, partial [Dongia mobilis]